MLQSTTEIIPVTKNELSKLKKNEIDINIYFEKIKWKLLIYYAYHIKIGRLETIKKSC